MSVNCQSTFHSSHGRSSWVRYQRRGLVPSREAVTKVSLRLAPYFPASLSRQISPMLKSLLSRAILLNSISILLMSLCWSNPQTAQICFCAWWSPTCTFQWRHKGVLPTPITVPQYRDNPFGSCKQWASCAVLSPHPPDSAMDSGPAPWGKTGRGKRCCPSTEQNQGMTSQATVAHHNSWTSSICCF